MTILKGKPDVPVNTPLTAQLTYARPYQQGTRLGIGTHQLVYDWADNRWEVDGPDPRVPFDLVAARFNQNDPAPQGEVRLLFKTGSGAGTTGGVLYIRPVETAVGETDITKPVGAIAFVSGPTLEALIASLTGLNTNVQTGLADLTEKLAQTDQSLADIAQSQAQNNAQTTQFLGLKAHTGEPNTIPMQAGTYRIVGGSATALGQIYERAAGGALTRRPSLEVPRPEWYVEDFGIYPDADFTATATAWQVLLDSLPNTPVTLRFQDGRNYNFDRTAYLIGRSNILIKGENTRWTCRGGVNLPASLVVSAVPLDRTLTGTAWGLQFLTHSFDTTTPINKVYLEGIHIKSETGANIGTYPIFYFADDSGLIDTRVDNSGGAGVEWRCSNKPYFRDLIVGRAGTYGIFAYQCHAIDGSGYTMLSGGRALIVKEAHKKFVNSNEPHIIERIDWRDLVGFPAVGQAGENPVWAAGGVSMNDIQLYVDQGTPGYTQAMADARNFLGHERVPPVIIRGGIMQLTLNAPANAATPMWAPGAFADGWRLQQVVMQSDGREMTNSAMAIGNIGSIVEGKAKGGRFGKDHVVEDVILVNYNTESSGKALIQYGVSHTLRRVRTLNTTVKRVHYIPPAPAGQAADFYMPFGTVGSVEITDCNLAWTQALAYQGEFGITVPSTVDKFITGGNTFTVTPKDNTTADTILNPLYIRAQEIEVRGRDKLICKSNPASAKHGFTYPVIIESTQGELPRLDIEVDTPTRTDGTTNVRGLWHYAPAGVTALAMPAYRPGRFKLSGTPTGEKVASRMEREVAMQNAASAQYLGTWATQLNDQTGGQNQQGARRIIWLSAPPTSGTYAVGDWCINPTPAVRGIWMWRCTVAGTPGTWDELVDADITYGDAAPTTGTYRAGHLHLRTGSTGALGINIGWVCRASGSPGSWEPFGQMGVRVITGAPSFNAFFVGEELLDQTSGAKRWYKAVSVGSGAADWVALN